MTLLADIGVSLPIVQAPMAGTSTTAMAAAVCEAGALGSIAVGAVEAALARTMIREVRARTSRPFNVNVFTHRPGAANPAVEADWIAALAPLFAQFGAEPPTTLRPIYKSFVEDEEMQAALIEFAPAVVSFHFGLPDAQVIAALKYKGSLLLSTATNAIEAQAAERAGIDAVVAQGFEAGGHRGFFDPDQPDEQLGMEALTRLLVKRGRLPVIAAGGIMNGAGIAAALNLGAEAAQLGTAFVGCPESNADAGYRAALFSDAARRTMMTDAISGRPARCLANRFTAWGETHADLTRPSYPRVYDAGKALNAAAKASGETGYGAQWAGQGAPQVRALPAAELVRVLAEELKIAKA